MAHFYFFDLPVYRLNEDDYHKQREAYIEEKIFHPETTSNKTLRSHYQQRPESLLSFRNYLEKKYGGCWRFNEIIGYIRLHFLGSQVRGVYFSSSHQRITRTRKKTIEFKTLKLAPEVEISQPYGSDEVLLAIKIYIEDCKKAVPNRIIDTSLFDVISKHVDWSALLQNSR